MGAAVADLESRLRQALAGRYAVEREVGHGGMAVVFLARDLRIERRVAIKVLRPEIAAALGPDRFLREIRLSANLSHPHILPLHDSGEADGLLYFVMPFVDGESLRGRLTREGPLTVEDAIRIAREVAGALDYAHAHDVVHRDIKPENILLQAGQAVVSDFGIARAISAAAEPRMTAAGVAVGTVAYMSPEQTSGEHELDGRSDIYSLGCVLYEMLTGRAPARSEEAARALLVERPEARGLITRAVTRALAPRPEDRFQTAGEFAVVLAGRRSAPWSRWTEPGGRRWVVLAAGAALLVTTAVWRLATAGPSLDPTRFVILPLRSPGDNPSDGARYARLLQQGFARWQDITVADPLVVSDVLNRRRARGPGSQALDLGTALRIARDLKAGRLVWGEGWTLGDTTFVAVGVYDVVRDGRRMGTRTARLTAGVAESSAIYALVDSVLVGGARLPVGATAAAPTLSTGAVRAHEDGHQALDVWDLGRAAAEFRQAIAQDTDFAHAYVELAQVLAWAEAPVEQWREAAARAVHLAEGLGPRERRLAQALSATAAGRLVDACAHYRALVARDSLDATAWYGLAECQANDEAVVRDSASPSGWRFRGSFHSAALAYLRALELAPSLNLRFRGQVYARLSRQLYSEPHYLRRGRAVPPDTGLFAAFPDVLADTFAFIPHPLTALQAGRSPTKPQHGAEALARSRGMLAHFVEQWVAAFPQDPEAHSALAQVLEMHGRLASSGRRERSALTELREAQRLTSDTGTLLEIVVDQVRLLVKLERFDAARQLADSLLAAWPDPEPQRAETLAGLAALTGRGHLLAELLRRTAPAFVPLQAAPLPVPLPIAESALRFLAYASVGAPVDSVAALYGRVDSLLRVWVLPARRVAMRRAVLQPALTLAFPVIRPEATDRPEPGDYLADMQWRLLRGDTASVRARLGALRAGRAAIRPGEVDIEAVYQEALLWLAIGDSAVAGEHLANWLKSLAGSRRGLLWRAPPAAALVRAMALWAELARKQGEPEVAKQWASAVRALWANADPELGPTIRRMEGM